MLWVAPSSALPMRGSDCYLLWTLLCRVGAQQPPQLCPEPIPSSDYQTHLLTLPSVPWMAEKPCVRALLILVLPPHLRLGLPGTHPGVSPPTVATVHILPLPPFLCGHARVQACDREGSCGSQGSHARDPSHPQCSPIASVHRDFADYLAAKNPLPVGLQKSKDLA